MAQSVTDTILMIRPVNFNFNAQTAVNNYYQKVIDGIDNEEVQERALKEFDNFVSVLRDKGIRVIVIEDTPEPETPDSIFPNNWISFHSDGRVGLYPMFAENRRKERRADVLEKLQTEYSMVISERVDLTIFEDSGKYLEGTGSMVLDRENRIAYAAISERTNLDVLEKFCENFQYKAVTFTAYQSVDGDRLPIYHTNVMMCIGDTFAVVCADCIDDSHERLQVVEVLEQTGKEIIYITEEQVHQFAGNMLEVRSHLNPVNKYLIMSGAAFHSLSEKQLDQLQAHCEIIHSSLDTIEALVGGSARCMMAEVFLPVSSTVKN